MTEEKRYNRDDLIRVRSWWYKDSREIICKVIRHYPKREPLFDEETESNLEVKPIKGYGHSRFIAYSRIIQENKMSSNKNPSPWPHATDAKLIVSGKKKTILNNFKQKIADTITNKMRSGKAICIVELPSLNTIKDLNLTKDLEQILKDLQKDGYSVRFVNERTGMEISW